MRRSTSEPAAARVPSATGSTAGLRRRKQQPAATAILHGLARRTAPQTQPPRHPEARKPLAGRHMTKGQRVMVVAKIYPEPERGGRGKTVRLPDGLSKQRISEARTVVQYAPAGSSQRWDSATVFDS